MGMERQVDQSGRVKKGKGEEELAARKYESLEEEGNRVLGGIRFQKAQGCGYVSFKLKANGKKVSGKRMGLQGDGRTQQIAS